MDYDIKKYMESQKNVKDANKQEKILDELRGNNLSEVRTLFYQKERILYDQKHKHIKIIEVKYDKNMDKLKKSVASDLQKLKEYKHILAIKKVTYTNPTLQTNHTVYKFDYLKDKEGNSDYSKDRQKIEYTKLETLEKNNFLIMDAHITDNRKPKNKFSLVVIGNTFFNEKILDNIPYHYGIDAHVDNTNIQICIKDFPHKNDAVVYYHKHKDKILKNFREDHAKFILKYNDVIENTNTIPWNIASLEEEKRYFENCYSNWSEETRYKEIVKEIQQLNRSVRK